MNISAISFQNLEATFTEDEFLSGVESKTDGVRAQVFAQFPRQWDSSFPRQWESNLPRVYEASLPRIWESNFPRLYGDNAQGYTPTWGS